MPVNGSWQVLVSAMLGAWGEAGLDAHLQQMQHGYHLRARVLEAAARKAVAHITLHGPTQLWVAKLKHSAPKQGHEMPQGVSCGAHSCV